ncbi:hypothetical protein MTR_3g006620 [Medicago truncatula]|uniref:Uncharacterized protein n=1 Tax=Medicago truncatula TaxID=3880 RepID=A0A072V3U4_MEDTR|nr:hypothetical protein MTR_3g006620 [Medicago truncatula]
MTMKKTVNICKRSWLFYVFFLSGLEGKREENFGKKEGSSGMKGEFWKEMILGGSLYFIIQNPHIF